MIEYQGRTFSISAVATFPKWVRVDGESQEALYLMGRNAQELCVSQRIKKVDLIRIIADKKLTDEHRIIIELVNR